MKRKVLFSLLSILLLVFQAKAQTAPDFTATDCDNNVFNLYNQVDNGKVVVIVWVMPCATCIGPALTAYNIVESYRATNPGKILYWLVDDYANTTCVALKNWAIGYNIWPNISTFSTPVIDMNAFGGPGMPKVVIVAGGTKQVLFNQNNSLTISDFQNAMDNALLLSSTGDEKSFSNQLSPVYYPLEDILLLSFSSAINDKVDVVIFDSLGKKVFESRSTEMRGPGTIEIRTPDLKQGLYFVNAQSESFTVTSKIMVAGN